MASNGQAGRGRQWRRWRLFGWGSAALLLLHPLVAMQFIEGVAWDESDFILFGAMLLAAGGTLELATRISRSNAYRAAIGIAIAASFLLVWINLAVGIIGTENEPANLMFGGVIAVAITGAIIARLRPDGMARAARDGGRPGIGRRYRGERPGAGPSKPGDRNIGDQRPVHRFVAGIGLAVPQSGAGSGSSRGPGGLRAFSHSTGCSSSSTSLISALAE